MKTIKKKKKIFFISPVRSRVGKRTQVAIEEYVRKCEREGYEVHYPTRDTKQDDPSGGYNICRENFQAFIEADEIHIWYLEKSNGSKFDFGGVFMYCEMLDHKKRIHIVNKKQAEARDKKKKSFLKVMKHLTD